MLISEHLFSLLEFLKEFFVGDATEILDPLVHVTAGQFIMEILTRGLDLVRHERTIKRIE